jgi:hypothetical protein
VKTEQQWVFAVSEWWRIYREASELKYKAKQEAVGHSTMKSHI